LSKAAKKRVAMLLQKELSASQQDMFMERLTTKVIVTQVSDQKSAKVEVVE
jgi:hypothetical protein